MSTTVLVSEVEKDFALYHDRALTEPVRVVRDGQETVCIVSARTYRHLKRSESRTASSAKSDGSERREFTVREAADLLLVSPSYLRTLLEAGEIQSYGVGPRERIRAADLFDYRARSDATRRAAIDEMVAIAQELGLD